MNLQPGCKSLFYVKYLLLNLRKLILIYINKVSVYLSSINTTARHWNNRFAYRTSKHL